MISQKYYGNHFDHNKVTKSGVYVINVLRTNFLYERRFSCYFLALKELSYEKFASLTLMKLTTIKICSLYNRNRNTIK